ncbi:pentapeptide repeat-containing protein [Acerihabitans sp.]|uniref:pentapeptide repeat-containing protein n=1 Tax=Acerihabitans sp. TaxID=2811394 RepID=UPI002ED91509
MAGDIERLGMMAGYISGIGTEQARNEATRLQGMLEHVVDFFTFGYVQKNLNKQYDLLVKEIAIALDKASPAGISIPPTLIVDFNGHSITFTLAEENGADKNLVKVEVCKGKDRTTCSVDKANFSRISTGLIMCQRFNLPLPLVTPDNEGRLDLSNVDLSGRDLSNADLSHTILNNATLCGAKLAGARLEGAKVEGTLFYGADFESANLNGIFTHGVDMMNFRGANLKNAYLGQFPPAGPLLTLPPVWDDYNLNFYFDHLTNLPGNSLLTMLKSIDDRYADIKLRMMREIRHSLSGVDVSGIADALRDFAGDDPNTGYAGKADIRHWLPEG